ncbi:hypothetical protein NOF55_02865 [Rhizobiaceae bacterium BDR2-2]|uniref:Uncharacterized protein n=1 Tax=Ectorhizobium quercum TaxID=2965071 RepID=A0AAE3STK3_9HYPH|nr:hypothetical protein [Ectorhizobium quercum]MCX8996037.1 hypothetical protein [Ectorhizobium quercum]
MWEKLFGGKKNSGATAGNPPPASAAPAEIKACQTELARAVAASITDLYDGEWEDRDWLRIVVNHEALWDQPQTRTSSLNFTIARRPGEALEKMGFRLSPAAREGFQRLAALMQAQGGSWWTVCDLVIERDGRFDFTFSYGQPYRIDGNLNDQRFRDYLERYRAETGN